jgi:hypothetical protein
MTAGVPPNVFQDVNNTFAKIRFFACLGETDLSIIFFGEPLLP